jgi:hypothetical protein
MVPETHSSHSHLQLRGRAPSAISRCISAIQIVGLLAFIEGTTNIVYLEYPIARETYESQEGHYILPMTELLQVM